MKCYRKGGGCGPYEMLSCGDCPASKPEYVMGYQPSIKTHADRVRAMSDEELAKYLAGVANDGGGSCAPGCHDCAAHNCKEAWLDWLRQEAET